MRTHVTVVPSDRLIIVDGTPLQFGFTAPANLHAVGSSEHAHGVSDPGHAHAVATEAHNHTLTDGGHSHTVTAKAIGTVPPYYALCFIQKL